MPAPMPLEAPVTMATFPLSLLIALRSLNLCCQFDVSTTIELMRWGGKGFGGFGDFLCGSVVPSGLIRWGLFTQDCVLGYFLSSLWDFFRSVRFGFSGLRSIRASFFRPFGTFFGWVWFTQDCVLGWSQSSLRDLSGGACLPRTASWANFFRPFG